jgi:hypothetical protein
MSINKFIHVETIDWGKMHMVPALSSEKDLFMYYHPELIKYIKKNIGKIEINLYSKEIIWTWKFEKKNDLHNER